MNNFEWILDWFYFPCISWYYGFSSNNKNNGGKSSSIVKPAEKSSRNLQRMGVKNWKKNKKDREKMAEKRKRGEIESNSRP